MVKTLEAQIIGKHEREPSVFSLLWKKQNRSVAALHHRLYNNYCTCSSAVLGNSFHWQCMVLYCVEQVYRHFLTRHMYCLACSRTNYWQLWERRTCERIWRHASQIHTHVHRHAKCLQKVIMRKCFNSACITLQMHGNSSSWRNCNQQILIASKMVLSS